MESLIVTVSDRNRSFFIDLEIPSDLVWEKLSEDVVETLNGYRPELSLPVLGTAFMCMRLKEILPDDKTLREAGIWNGDYLIIL